MREAVWNLGSALFATAMLGIVFLIPRQYVLPSAFTGMAGWAVYYFLLRAQLCTATLATLAATILVALCAQIIARRARAPVTMFLIPGIIPLVPGAGMYRTAVAALSGSLADTLQRLMETMLLAGAIALGVFIVDTLFRSLFAAQKTGRSGGEPPKQTRIPPT